jgi:hypothetical protein
MQEQELGDVLSVAEELGEDNRYEATPTLPTLPTVIPFPNSDDRRASSQATAKRAPRGVAAPSAIVTTIMSRLARSLRPWR